MLQPFLPFEKKYLSRLQSLNKRYLVSQSYPRGMNHLADIPAVPVLLTDYDDPGLARTHWNAVKQDPLASVIDLNNASHAQKLEEMMQKDSGYSLFWSVFPSAAEVERRISLKYRDHIRRYMTKVMHWTFAGPTPIRPKIEVIFGELHLHLRYGGYDQLRVKFEEIEKA
jgi:hypothetical protein